MSLGPRHSVRGSRATVVGAARSGLAAARLLNTYGSQVFVTES
ncbi:MAG: UDP-N-acetylmuramoylalanine-D-glutamate ligase, partial [Rhodothermales bacterium]